MKLTVIIPAHNEEKTIGQVLREVLALSVPGWSMEVIAVDDGSTDKTGEIADGFSFRGVVKIKNPFNMGKGASVKNALRLASGDYVLIQDADGEYFTKDIPKLLSMVQENDICAVFGSRGVKAYPERGFHYVIGAKILTWFFNLLYGQNLKDLYTGYKLLPLAALKSLGLSSKGFEFEAEVACRLALRGCKIREVAINFKPRSRKQGKHIRFIDAYKGLKKIFEIKIKNS